MIQSDHWSLSFKFKFRIKLNIRKETYLNELKLNSIQLKVTLL